MAAALLALRPQLGFEAALADRVDRDLRPRGYRVAGAFGDGSATAGAAVGFRVTENLAWGRFVYVDDLSTLPDHRGRGLARGAPRVRRDGGVPARLRPAASRLRHRPDGWPRTRLYFTSGMRISSHHFSPPL